MREFIIQRIPGYLSADDQIALARDLVQSAAELLQFSERDQLEEGIETIRKPLVCLVAAGVLSEITFAFHDEDSVCGVTVSFDAYNMEDFEETDLSRLRLVASPTGAVIMEIVCLDGAIAHAYINAEWLPPSHPRLAWHQVHHNEHLEKSHLLGGE
jgi:hypothetical protein